MLATGSQVKPYLDILYRRRWWIGVPVLLGVVGGGVVLSRLPKVYQASTTILVTPQRVPESFIQPTVTSRLEERVSTIVVQILSRNYLETIAREFHLVSAEPTEAEIEGACAAIAGRVQIEWDRESRAPNWFKLEVDDENPKMAAGIANRLASLFIAQNTELRAGQARTTLETSARFLKELKAKLDAKEGQLAEYKRGRLWELPEQLSTNMTLLSSAEARIQQLTNDIAMRSERIAGLRVQSAQAVAAAVQGVAPPTVDPAQQRLAQLQAELNQLLIDKTDEHPDVRKKRSEIASHLALNTHLQNSAIAQGGKPAGPLPNLYDVQIAQLEREIRSIEATRASLMGQTSTYHSRIASAPSRQQELELRTRDMETLRQEYNEWLRKESEARHALEMESASMGEQFQVQDPAAVPTLPYKPNPVQVVLLGLLVGFALGVGSSFLAEFLDNTIRTEEEFHVSFPDLPLLASIPDLDHGPAAARTRGRSGGTRAAVWLLLVLGPALGATSVLVADPCRMLP